MFRMTPRIAAQRDNTRFTVILDRRGSCCAVLVAQLSFVTDRLNDRFVKLRALAAADRLQPPGVGFQVGRQDLNPVICPVLALAVLTFTRVLKPDPDAV